MARVPVLEEAPEAEGHELQRGLDDEGGGEDVVAVLERRLQRLRQKQSRSSIKQTAGSQTGLFMASLHLLNRRAAVSLERREIVVTGPRFARCLRSANKSHFNKREIN